MARGQTGLGITFTLATDGAVALIQSITMPNWEMEALDFTNLSDTPWQIFKPGDIANPGTASLDVFLDSSGAMPSLGLVQVATITIPGDPTGTMTIVGSGFINSIEFGTGSVNEPLIATLGFQYDGLGTPPLATPAS